MAHEGIIFTLGSRIKPPCQYHIFEVEKMNLEQEKQWQVDRDDYNKIRMASVLEVITQYEAYDLSTYLAEVGGYLGLFVGLSVFDLVCLLG